MRFITFIGAAVVPAVMAGLMSSGSIAAADSEVFKEFEAAPVSAPVPGCTGTARASVRGQSAIPSPAYEGMDVGSYTFSEVTVWFDRDKSDAPVVPDSACALPATVTLRNLDTGAEKTETVMVTPTGFRQGGAQVSLRGPGRIEASVSTNPNPATIEIVVPQP
ncbi:hypothetical protein NDR87_22975 [Nocardia sp. CDC159]|uniref:Uncharacterized protein n=1 Tax=Nocardia pulmonis TaxID=2951408 RepID=A0A9X2EAH4_9NOCA|nr:MULTISPECIES: hypothetical protein [Nocardia]MCM6776615.1 hypothetical protein [Nocardia pulmonis]MCM6789236.1 hypothetical protein [Nocardia sp. CDC159]